MSNTDLIQRAAELRQTADAMEAFAAGKKIQQSVNRGWVDWVTLCEPSWTVPMRPAPESRTRPWSKPEDVPGPVCWIRVAGKLNAGLVNWIDLCGIGTTTSKDMTVSGRGYAWNELRDLEYSTDRLNWQPCVVTEEAP